MAWINLTREQVFSLEILQAFFGLLFGVLGIYFILRWGITLGRVNKESHELLLGKFISDALSDQNLMHALVAIYIGVAFFRLMVHASAVKQRLEVRHRSLLYHHSRAQPVIL
jgi:hypothetical protein